MSLPTKPPDLHEVLNRCREEVRFFLRDEKYLVSALYLRQVQQGTSCRLPRVGHVRAGRHRGVRFFWRDLVGDQYGRGRSRKPT